MFEVKNPYFSDERLNVEEEIWNEAVEACRQEHDRLMRELFEELEEDCMVIEWQENTPPPECLVISKPKLNVLKERFGGK